MAERGSTPPLTIGELVGFYRRQRGWTQQTLAMRLDRSPSWVEKIEQGERQIDSIRMVLDLAKVLGVPPGRLMGKPLAPALPTGPEPETPEPAGAVLELRQVLLHYDSIHGLPSDRGGDGARPLLELERDTRRAWRLFDTRKDRLSSVVWLLPGLLRQGRLAEQDAAEGSPERRRAWRVLTELYRLAAWELWYQGEDDLAWIAADRAISTAELADDRLRVAAAARALQQALLAHGQLEDVIALGEATAERLAPTSSAPPEELTIWGSAMLIAAFAAARIQDRAEYERLWRNSSAAAERLGDDRRDFHLDFGPGMAAIQHVGMLVELYEPMQALRVAGQMPADPLPTIDRRCFHRIHQAKAHYLRRRDDEAFGLLVEARGIAPEIIRYQAMVREMVRAMLRRRRTSVPAEVRELAEYLQVIPA